MSQTKKVPVVAKLTGLESPQFWRQTHVPFHVSIAFLGTSMSPVLGLCTPQILEASSGPPHSKSTSVLDSSHISIFSSGYGNAPRFGWLMIGWSPPIWIQSWCWCCYHCHHHRQRHPPPPHHPKLLIIIQNSSLHVLVGYILYPFHPTRPNNARLAGRPSYLQSPLWPRMDEENTVTVGFFLRLSMKTNPIKWETGKLPCLYKLVIQYKILYHVYVYIYILMLYFDVL